jgi:1-pyrroline-5-carboxylate dehydrogenase
MSNAFFEVPIAANEPVLPYGPGSPEKKELKKVYNKMKASTINIPMVIGGKRVNTKDKRTMHPPHDKKHVLGTFSHGDKTHVERAINAALKAKSAWEDMPWQERASIFLRAADLLAGPYRARMNAATMLCQSKNAYQAEIDAVCELCDFLRFNVQYMIDIYAQQPESAPGIWNKLEYRPLEGFVFAITPFNFTSIAANLAAAPALMGNTVVWKPAESQIYSAHVIMDLFQEAGLPDGVINLVFADGPETGDVVFNHRDFAGLHFTGSTGVFKTLWRTIGANLDTYRTYPRIVGETGGKDFVVAHKSTDPKVLATALVRGAFEYQGQKCSAASRAYIPKSLWEKTWKFMKADIESMKMGSPEDFTNFVNAVIDAKSYKNIKSYISSAKRSKDAKILIGGNCSDTKGYFVEPTVILAKKADYKTMCEEIFGPVLSVYVYKDTDFEKILDVVDSTSEYALTGSIFSNDRSIVELASKKLRNAAGNFYINDKPTGAVVGQQPFGGARGSGTNDKAGSYLNLLRWVSPRTIKETFVPPTNYRYPFMIES